MLANLLGVDEGASSLSIQGDLALSSVDADPAVSLAEAYTARTDYAAARASVEAQLAAVNAARAGHFPTVSLKALYGGRWGEGASVGEEGARDPEDVGRVGIVLDIPLFEGGRTAGRVREEQAKLGAAREALRKLELRIRLEVERALLNISFCRKRVAAGEKAIEQGKESLRIEREKYELGRGSVTDVLDAQAALLGAQTSYFTALAEYNISVAELRLATGEE